MVEEEVIHFSPLFFYLFLDKGAECYKDFKDDQEPYWLKTYDIHITLLYLQKLVLDRGPGKGVYSISW